MLKCLVRSESGITLYVSAVAERKFLRTEVTAKHGCDKPQASGMKGTEAVEVIEM